MHRMNYEKGRHRVLLIGIGDDTEEKREKFCENVSEIYGIPFPLLKKVVEHCPTVLKRNLTLEKAEVLAKTLRSFGAVVSVEEKRDSSAVSLEFQEMVPHRLVLESSYLRKTEGGTWNVIGRARNISDESLNDIWVLIQLFDEFEELLTFEEVPLPINPLPPGEASPFKGILERDLPIKTVSIGFKNSSGTPVPAIDKREKKEWVEVKWETKDEEDDFPSLTFPSIEDVETQPAKRSEPSVQSFEPQRPPLVVEEIPKMIPVEEEKTPQDYGVFVDEESFPTKGFKAAGSFEPPAPLPMTEDIQKMITLEEEKISEESLAFTNEKTLLGKEFELARKGEDITLSSEQKETGGEKQGKGPSQPEPPPSHPFILEKEKGVEMAVDSPNLEPPPPSRENIFPEAHFDVSIFEEATRLLEEISEKTGKREKEEPPSFSWIEDFRKSVETYYQQRSDLFGSWFEAERKNEGFAHSLHSLLTILIHARFNQKNQSEPALKNTQKVFKLVLQPNLLLEEVPLLEGTPFFTGEIWRELFHRSIPKLNQVANNIIEKPKWNAYDLERFIQIIPHMSDKNSRMAIRWIHELIPETVEIDFSNAPIFVGDSLFRVSSRLGVIDPHFDYYQNQNSIGHLKIQRFAKVAYPQYPIKIEEPMIWVGMMKEEGGAGFCLPTQPHCEGCLFETFCPRLCVEFNPSENGVKGGK